MSSGDRGQYAKVREEFIRDVSSWTPKAEEEDEKQQQQHHTGFKKRGKMMKQHQINAERDAESGAAAGQVQLCNKIKRGDPCPFGETCKFSHDVDAYLAHRPADLGETCPVFRARGSCAMGYTCRFVGDHLTQDKFQIPAEETAAGERQRQVLQRIREKTYEFTGSHVRECGKRELDLRGKVYVAPLTTVGNLPFRRCLVDLQCDITCGEMALAYNLVRGVPSEWALLKKHASERTFGVQIAASRAEEVSQVMEIISRDFPEVDFVDLNLGCPIDDVTGHGAGSALLRRPAKLMSLVEAATKAAPQLNLGLKMRTGWDDDKKVAHKIIEGLGPGADRMITYLMVHGRSRLQRYSKTANWEYISNECAPAARKHNIQFVGNGDILSYKDYWRATTSRLEGGTMDPDAPIATALIGRGALIKPWICTEIKERRVWDIAASERLEIVKKFAHYGLEHWGSDQRGVDTTRRYLLEWLSFAHRYVPVGICEEGYEQHINHRPPSIFVGRNDLETLLSSPNSADWEKIAEMFLGKPAEGYRFVPKHKANAW